MVSRCFSNTSCSLHFFFFIIEVATFTVQIYDTLLTLDEEVSIAAFSRIEWALRCSPYLVHIHLEVSQIQVLFKSSLYTYPLNSSEWSLIKGVFLIVRYLSISIYL